MSSETNQKLLRYGDLLTRKMREDITAAELTEMEQILTDLNLSKEQITERLEALVKENY